MDPSPSLTDEALVAAARGGDREALDALVARYEPRVYRFGLSMCRNVEDARDVLQDTLLSMVRSLGNFRAESSLSTWLYAIAHHACLKKRRHGVFTPARLESLDALEPAVRDRVPANTATPEQIATTHELQASLRTAMKTLDEDHRSVLVLRDVEGLTAPEAAEVLGISVAAVKSRLHRARGALRQALAPVLGPSASPATPSCHHDIVRRFSEHLEGDLSPTTCAEMEAHVASCPACEAMCTSLRRVLRLCQTSAADVPETTRAAVRTALRACLSDQPVNRTTA